ncbi:ArsR/SmtB family transcription factor [Sphingomonas sp. UYP23]
MREGPDFARIGSLIGDPVRASMLLGLLRVPALTAGELAKEGGVTAPTASSHLAQLYDGGLVDVVTSGRHRYYRLADADVAHHLEQLLGLAQHLSHSPTRPGPNEPAVRRARVCYDHLAGEIAVELFERLRARGGVRAAEVGITLTPSGHAAFLQVGIDLSATGGTRPVCRECLDWSERRPHLAGIAGAALLSRMVELGWLCRVEGSRAMTVTVTGDRALTKLFA